MTKTEFYDYVKSFGKNPGEYSSEETYKICVAHKNLDSGKSWDEVASLLGSKKSGNALRLWTFRRQEEDGTVRRNVHQLTDKTVDQLTDEEAKENIGKQLEEIYIAKTQARDSWNAYRRTLRDEARVRSMMDSIKEISSSMKTLPIVSIPPSTDTDSEAILMLSDLHLGVDCDNYYNFYNEDIAAERLSKLVRETVDYCLLHKVQVLHVLNLGDMIHGLIHTNARLEQEFDVTSQIMKAAELLTETINLLREAAPVVTYRSVVDNHSRAVPNKTEHIEKENFSRIIDWYIESRLANTDVIFPHDNIDEGIGMFTISNGKKVMFAHGHQDSPNCSMQNYVGLTKEWVDYILLAHYHSAKTKEFQGCDVIINGSIVGTEQYAFGKRLFSEPSQTLLIFNRDNLINVKIKL